MVKLALGERRMDPIVCRLKKSATADGFEYVGLWKLALSMASYRSLWRGRTGPRGTIADHCLVYPIRKKIVDSWWKT